METNVFVIMTMDLMEWLIIVIHLVEKILQRVFVAVPGLIIFLESKKIINILAAIKINHTEIYNYTLKIIKLLIM